MFDLNPIDVINKRSLKTLPPHFSKIKVYEQDFLLGNEIEEWIAHRLKGRYSITKMPHVADDGKLKNSTFIGFEDQKELTFFMLACPFIRRS